MDAGAAELVAVERLAGEGLDHARPADEGVGVLGHHHVVGQAEQQRGPDTTGPVAASSTGTRPGAARQRAGGGAPAVQGGDAVVHVGAARRDHAQERQAGAEGVLGGLGEGVAVGLGQRAPPALVGDLAPARPRGRRPW